MYECHNGIVGFIFMIKQPLEGLQFNKICERNLKIVQPYLYKWRH